MEENFILDMIKKSVEEMVSEKIEEEINLEVKNFREKLEYRKDNYIAEVMKGIRIYHQKNPERLGIDYKIVFENIIKLKD